MTHKTGSSRDLKPYYYYYYYYSFCLLSQAFSSWYLPSLTNGNPQRSGFKFQTAVLSVLCVPSKAVVWSESIECFPATVSKFLSKLFVTIPVAPIITGIIIFYMFQISCNINSCISTFFTFHETFLSSGIATYVLFFVFNYYNWPVYHNFSMFVS
jgi:hypothetical protein